MQQESIARIAHYIGSYPSEKDCPSSNLPEYTFIGRSNVGKSSLINALLGRRDLARTSKNPGKTQSINLYRVDDAWNIADLPGYGYAKVSKTQRQKWQKMIEKYLVLRPNLVSAFVLIDLRHPLQAVDKDFIHWLGERRVPFALVFTKADKIAPPKLAGHRSTIESALVDDWEELPAGFVTSSASGLGINQVQDYIAALNREVQKNLG